MYVYTFMQGDVAVASYLYTEDVKSILSGSVHGIIGASNSKVTGRIAYLTGNKYSLPEVLTIVVTIIW